MRGERCHRAPKGRDMRAGRCGIREIRADGSIEEILSGAGYVPGGVKIFNSGAAYIREHRRRMVGDLL